MARLIGLGVSGFSDMRPHHLSLLDAGAELNPAHVEERRTKLDALRERYGAEAVVRGRLFHPVAGQPASRREP